MCAGIYVYTQRHEGTPTLTENLAFCWWNTTAQHGLHPAECSSRKLGLTGFFICFFSKISVTPPMKGSIYGACPSLPPVLCPRRALAGGCLLQPWPAPSPASQPPCSPIKLPPYLGQRLARAIKKKKKKKRKERK